MSSKTYCAVGIYLEIPHFKTSVTTLVKKDSKGNITDAIFDPYNGQKLKFEVDLNKKGYYSRINQLTLVQKRELAKND